MGSGHPHWQCRPRANCVYLCLPSDSASLHPHQGAGPGAHSVGKGLNMTAAPTSDQHSSSLSPDCGRRLPTVSSQANCVYLPRLLSVPHSSLSRLTVLGAHSVGLGLSVTAKPTSDQHFLQLPAVFRLGPTVSFCACPRTVAHSLFASTRCWAPTVLAPATCVGWRQSLTIAPLTCGEEVSQSVSWVTGYSGGLLDW